MADRWMHRVRATRLRSGAWLAVPAQDLTVDAGLSCARREIIIISMINAAYNEIKSRAKYTYR